MALGSEASCRATLQTLAPAAPCAFHSPWHVLAMSLLRLFPQKEHGEQALLWEMQGVSNKLFISTHLGSFSSLKGPIFSFLRPLFHHQNLMQIGL